MTEISMTQTACAPSSRRLGIVCDIGGIRILDFEFATADFIRSGAIRILCSFTQARLLAAEVPSLIKA
jgi:hypothetical protein